MKKKQIKRVFESITSKEIKKIHVQTRQIGLSKEDLYETIENLIGIPSITALSKWEAAHLIARMDGETRWARPRRPRTENQIPGNAKELPYLGHIKGIRAIIKNLEWDKEHFKNWLKKYMGVKSIRELNRKRARDTFIALKKIQSQAFPIL
ncbi:conserved hypothetical protein [Candidatus Magnetomoraceae bacterium gMMP-15]